jgi:hypothetical protein
MYFDTIKDEKFKLQKGMRNPDLCTLKRSTFKGSPGVGEGESMDLWGTKQGTGE